MRAGVGKGEARILALLFNCWVSLLVSPLSWLAGIDIINSAVSSRTQNALKSGSLSLGAEVVASLNVSSCTQRPLEGTAGAGQSSGTPH